MRAASLTDTLRQRLAVLQLSDRKPAMQQFRHRPAAKGGPSEGVDIDPIVSELPMPTRVALAEWPLTCMPCASLCRSERKIDQFEARLAGIEGMLRELTLSLTNRNMSAPTTHSPAGLASGGQPAASA